MAFDDLASLGISTLIRTKTGMYIDGKGITAPLLARFLLKTGMSAHQIHQLLEPGDAQDVPKAVGLVRALRKVADIPDAVLSATEIADKP
jgi:hypothetical protein